MLFNPIKSPFHSSSSSSRRRSIIDDSSSNSSSSSSNSNNDSKYFDKCPFGVGSNFNSAPTGGFNTATFSSPPSNTFGTNQSSFGNTGGFANTGQSSFSNIGNQSAIGGMGSGFGATKSSPFGGTSGTSSPFGKGLGVGGGIGGAGTNYFGGTQNTSFGAAPQSLSPFSSGMNQGMGTKSTPFRPFQIQDGSTNGVGNSVNIQCITAMDEYKNKSQEELRLEDYKSNNRGPGNQSAGVFGGGMNTFGGGMQQAAAPFGSVALAQSSPFSLGQPAATTTPSFGSWMMKFFNCFSAPARVVVHGNQSANGFMGSEFGAA